MTEVRKNEELHRWEAVIDGHVVGYATWVTLDDWVEIPHTEVDPAFGGRGIAGDIVRFALEDIAAQGRKVIPTCSFTASWIKRHPDYTAHVLHGHGQADESPLPEARRS